MPILVRPVREQLEHDRIIRLLEAKWKRKFKVDANPGDERNAGIKVSTGTIFPDLVLTEEGGRKPKALIEVETSESVNHLEARAQWAHLAKSRTSLLLFVPAGAVESARRLADENAIKVSELWTYLVLGDQVRFTSVFRENGLEPADLIEKAEMFTTERPAPAPRPIVVEPPPEPAAVAAVPDRPRKLAVKVVSKAMAEVTARSLPKPGAKVPLPTPVKVVVAPVAAKLTKGDAAPVAPVVAVKPAKGVVAPKPIEKPVAEKVAPTKVVAPPKPVPEKKAPEKPAAAKPAPVKTAPPAKAAPAKIAAPAKAAAPAKVPPPAKVAAPAKPVSTKVAPKPVAKAAAKPVAKPAPKPVVKKAAAKPAAPKPAIKKAAAPAKAAKTAKRK